MSSSEVDLFVIGAGSGGVRGARVAAALGARVAVAEERFFGGTCVNVGCIPKKLFSYGAHLREDLDDARAYGWDVAEPALDWPRLIANKDKEIARLNGIYQRLLEGRGVEILRGRATLEGASTVVVTAPDGAVTRRTARHVLVATGGAPLRPTFPGAELAMISDEVFYLPKRPDRLLVIGGGYIAVEMAGIFRGYGAQVTQVYRGALFLRGFDRDVRTHLAGEMRHRGVDLRFHTDVASLARRADGALDAVLTTGETLVVDAVLAAVGRSPNARNLGLEAAGVALDERGAVRVDGRFRTSARTVYAVGDVIDRVQLTPVALSEAMIVAQNLFGGAKRAPDYEFIPSAVFSNPSIGTVGLTEDEAREAAVTRGGAVDIYRSTFTPLKHTLTGRAEKTLMKLVVERDTDRVVGVHVVGADAGEIVQGFAVALKMGATKAQLDATIGIHPTAAEELVTMREKCPEPDHTMNVEHVAEGAPPRRGIVHHRWEDSDAQ
ncbi:MAG: gor [Myxococcaceae bacterium]|nr:gor [Myxococcaceae bacterium]